MKTISLILLCLIGCASKPNIIATNQDVVRWCLDHQGDAKAEHYYCEELHGYKYIFDGVKPNYDKYDSRNLREFGEAKHVTRSQWEAAQGLYNSEVFCEDGKRVLLKYPDGTWRPYEHMEAMKMHGVTMSCAPPYPALTIFPPSGDAK